MTRVRISREASIPDPLRLSRYQKNPELGPRILFFSGGTAINGLARQLKHYTHNSIHLVSPFDSGGSSAKLRQAFDMPAIGDLRSRMMALADETVLGHPEIVRLFNTRLAVEAAQTDLRRQLDEMVLGKDALVADVPNPMRKLICLQLGFFAEVMPADFDLRGASVGNLILAGGYLNHHKQLDPIIFLFSKLVNVLGTVRTITDDHYQLVADLADGTRRVGQHSMTGKEEPPIQSPIERVFLTAQQTPETPVQSQLKKRNRKLIRQADLICYPPGSFYSSVIANLLPAGVPEAIAGNASPKIYIPNLGEDPEQKGMTLESSLHTLLSYLQTASGKTRHSRVLDFVLVDSRHGRYPGGIPRDLMQQLGIECIDTSLLEEKDGRRYDNDKLVATLLSLV